jgi:hypothetical protein
MFVIQMVAILSGILLTQIVIIVSKFSYRAQGYLWRAAGKIWFFLLCIYTIEWIIGISLFFLLSNYIPIPPLISALFLGIVLTVIPNSLEYFFLLRNPSEKNFQNPFIKLLKRFNLLILQEFSVAIQVRKQHDNIDLQHGNHPAVPKLSSREVGRRIRKLYALHMRAIATNRGDPTLLHRDKGCVPWENFYLLIRYLGRKRFFKSIKNNPISPPPLENWAGNERRRLRGTRADRSSTDPNEPTFPYIRCYDDQDLIDRILKNRKRIQNKQLDDD